MALRETRYGKECLLGKFEIDVPAGGGCYTKDPVEACFGCNFADVNCEKFDLEKICQCPPGMTWDKYDKLRKEYAKQLGNLTKEGFREYVKQNYKI